MEIQVHLFANLADYGPPAARGGAARVELPEGATVRDLLARLRIPDEGPRLLLVNGRDVDAARRSRRRRRGRAPALWSARGITTGLPDDVAGGGDRGARAPGLPAPLRGARGAVPARPGPAWRAMIHSIHSILWTGSA